SKYRPIKILATDYIFKPKIWKSLYTELLKAGACAIEVDVADPLGRGKDITCTSHSIKERNLIPVKQKEHKNTYNDDYNCGLVLRHTTISPDGNARPCALFPPYLHIFGNILEKGKSLFENDLVQKYYYISAPPINICSECTSKEYCEGCIFRGLSEKCDYRKTMGVVT
ncbi:MAG: SPASM domain-containing protein, partial [Candidatus Marsarchaeota archaeon]|nr:SPASM domain-containing protein [Candidatus Marsarchaeota archaeon]